MTKTKEITHETAEKSVPERLREHNREEEENNTEILIIKICLMAYVICNGKVISHQVFCVPEVRPTVTYCYWPEIT